MNTTLALALWAMSALLWLAVLTIATLGALSTGAGLGLLTAAIVSSAVYAAVCIFLVRHRTQ